MNRSVSLTNLRVMIPSQGESTDVWQEAPDAFARARSCPAALTTVVEGWTATLGPASPTQQRQIAASQPVSPRRFPRGCKVQLNSFITSL